MTKNRRINTDWKEILTNFQKFYKTIITSAKILQEGIDLPKCNTIAFIDRKISTIDCIQSRCLTKNKKKKISYINDLSVLNNNGTKNLLIF